MQYLQSTCPRSLQIIASLDLERRIKQVIHNHKINTLTTEATVRSESNLMSSQEANQHCVRIHHHVGIVPIQDFTEEAVFGVTDGLDHVLAIGRVVEERSGLAFRAELGEGGKRTKHDIAYQ